jgi:hypothetical protein
MREIRLSGSEGGGDREVSPYPYQPARPPALRFYNNVPFKISSATVK